MPMRGNSEVCHTIKNTAEFLQKLPIIKKYQPTFIAKKKLSFQILCVSFSAILCNLNVEKQGK